MWNVEPYQIIIFAIFVDFFLGLVFLIPEDLEVFNPIRNYNTWRQINWFGVIVGTIFLHIIFPVYAIIYWGCVLVTIGRK